MIKKKRKIALITGVNGQDGSYLAELLLEKQYEVHGTKRRSSVISTNRISHLKTNKTGTELDSKIILHHADLTDSSSLNRIVAESKPDEIYNLAAQSHVAVSFEEPEYTANTDALGCLRLLEIIRSSRREIKFYQASTSELFGGKNKEVLDEDSIIDPRSPYAAAKAYAYYLVKQYREAYGVYAVNGILFNHESPRRGANFVSQKIIRGIKQILDKEIDHILLGNLDAERDWGHAKDYVIAMWQMLQLDKPDDFVISTGRSTSVRDFCLKAFNAVGIELEFSGNGTKEEGKIVSLEASHENLKIGDILIRVDQRFFRPLEVNFLKGSFKKANKAFHWKPQVDLDDLIKDMLENEEIY